MLQVVLYPCVELGHVNPTHQCMVALNAERDLEGLTLLEELAPRKARDGVRWMQLHRMREACE